MKKVFLASIIGLMSPASALAAAAKTATDAQSYLKTFVAFVNSTIIPFLIGIAFLFFIINVVRYFVIGSTSDEGREKAKSLAIYGVAAFVFIIVFWGIINMLTSSLGYQNGVQPNSDYVVPKK